jgi:hypothetical protein
MEDPHLGVPLEAPSNPNEDERARIIAAVATVTFVAAITVAVRLYVRMKMLRSLGWDVSVVFSSYRYLN